jgi:hypothetical protein
VGGPMTPSAEPGRGELAALVSAALLSYPLGLALGSPWLLPILNTAPAYVVLVRRLGRGDRAGAVAAMLLWAAALAVGGTVAFASWPSPVDGLVLNGPAYRDEMLGWIRTGEGRESSLALFLPQHLLHLGAFVALCLATASTLGILLGAVLMNFMAFYVASLARAGVPAWAVVLLGWQPWALCRVAAFCVLGVVLAEPLLRRFGRFASRAPSGSPRRYLLAAGAGLLADCALKAALAPTWGTLLRGLLP